MAQEAVLGIRLLDVGVEGRPARDRGPRIRYLGQAAVPAGSGPVERKSARPVSSTWTRWICGLSQQPGMIAEK